MQYRFAWQKTDMNWKRSLYTHTNFALEKKGPERLFCDSGFALKLCEDVFGRVTF
jgi:hypothetical protein